MKIDKGQRNIIIIITIILIIIIILAIYFNSRNNRDIIDVDTGVNNEPNNNPNQGSEDNDTINTTDNGYYRINELNNDGLFFGIQDAINEYYYLLSLKDNTNLYKILDNDYKVANNITNSNASSIIKANYQSVTFTAQKIYYINYSNLVYCFVNGYVVNSAVNGGKIDYESSVNYILIINGDEFVIVPLSNVSDILEYAKTYKLKNIEINSDYHVNQKNVGIEQKLTTYLNEFRDLLYVDINRAYKMLDSSMLQKYNTLQLFKNDLSNIYNQIPSNVFGYNEKNSTNENIYIIVDSNDNKITITEYDNNNFKINF